MECLFITYIIRLAIKIEVIFNKHVFFKIFWVLSKTLDELIIAYHFSLDIFLTF